MPTGSPVHIVFGAAQKSWFLFLIFFTSGTGKVFHFFHLQNSGSAPVQKCVAKPSLLCMNNKPIPVAHPHLQVSGGPAFDYRTQRQMWVEFVVGSHPCSKRFFSGYSGFPLSSKTYTSKFQFDLESVPN